MWFTTRVGRPLFPIPHSLGVQPFWIPRANWTLPLFKKGPPNLKKKVWGPTGLCWPPPLGLGPEKGSKGVWELNKGRALGDAVINYISALAALKGWTHKPQDGNLDVSARLEKRGRAKAFAARKILALTKFPLFDLGAPNLIWNSQILPLPCEGPNF